MKLRRISASLVSIPFTTGGPQMGPWRRGAMQPWRGMDSLIVEVEAEDGATGVGEAFGHFASVGTLKVLTTCVAPWFIARDCSNVEATSLDAQKAFHAYGRSGPVQYALSGIDIALWDMKAKRAGVPLYRLLGGTEPTLDLYASLMRYGGDTAAVASNVTRARRAGYRSIKIHEQTVPAMLAASDAAGGATITVDSNCPWTVEEACAIARQTKDRNFGWLEEPIFPPEDFKGLARLRREGVPVSAGENATTLGEFRAMFEVGAVDVVQPSAPKVGGITGFLAIAKLAEASGVRLVPHCFYWGPAFLATAHLAAAMKHRPPLEIAFIDLEAKPHDLFDPHNPKLTLLDRPGIGFLPDPAVMKRYEVEREIVE